jgi:Glycosyltransferase sugar-binding region containing DXD motif
VPRIPKILHYCFGLNKDFGRKPWSLAHYVCVASAVKKIQPDVTYFYYQYEPSGCWWDLTKPMLQLVPIVAPCEIFGNPLEHPAHKADVVRLEKIIEHGGIYLDSDVLVQRSFDDLLDYSSAMGQEGEAGKYGMANAVILAEPKAPFMMRWYEEYRSFRGATGYYWSEHSAELPGRLAKQHPDEIHVLPPNAFFWPMWSANELKVLFESSEEIDVSACYANHLWESQGWQYLDHLTPGKVRAKDTNFNRWARPYLDGLPDDLGDRTLPEKTVVLAKKLARLILKPERA